MPSSDPKANALYRYVRSWRWFRLAIEKNEFVPRFCDEDFSWIEQGRPRCLFFPMVCFCDIPLSNSKSHKLAYGNFVIGLTKEWGIRRGLNPLMYVSEASCLAQKLGTKFHRNIVKPKLVSAEFGEFWPILPYLKPVQGFQRNGHSTELKFFEQEMEWRFVPDAWETSIESRQRDNRTTAEKDAQNAVVSGVRLNFDDADVRTVIVNSSEQRKRLHKIRPSLRGKVKLWREVGPKGSGR